MDVSGVAYGVRVRGNLPAEFRPYLRSPADRGAGAASSLDVRIEAVHELPEVEPIWATDPSPETAGRMALFREPAGFGLRVDGEGSGLFRITPGAIAIEWVPGGAGAAHYFFAYALPLWLESTGVPVLHASAVSFGARAVAFVGPSGMGKSTLCAGLVRSGCSFVADDGLPLREDENGAWWCAPGPPWLKLWPSALERQLGVPAADLPRVQDSLEKRMMACAGDDPSALPAGLELAAVYVLDGLMRDAREVTIRSCAARDALVRLIEHSLAPAPVASLGLSAQRLDRLARVVARAPVKRLRYPAGGDRWRQIHRAILEDLQGKTAQ